MSNQKTSKIFKKAYSFEQKIGRLRTFYQKHSYMPTFQEMLDIFGYKSKNAVFRFVKKLVEQGVLVKNIKGKVIFANTQPSADSKNAIKLLGSIQAGFPTPAQESLADTMTLDEWLIDKREATYMLTVSGDSMVDAGIFEGDVVLVERTNSPKVGEIVIAEVDGDWTMKYLRKKGQAYYLEAANVNYTDILPENEMKIEAIVRAVIRKYE